MFDVADEELPVVATIASQFADGGVDRHLVLPLELCPHAPKLVIFAPRRRDVVHDVDVDVVEHYHVAVRRRARHVVDDVAENDGVFG